LQHADLDRAETATPSKHVTNGPGQVHKPTDAIIHAVRTPQFPVVLTAPAADQAAGHCHVRV